MERVRRLTKGMYRVDKNGYPKEYHLFTKEEEKEITSEWISEEGIFEFNHPRWDFKNKRWTEGEPPEGAIQGHKDDKKEMLSNACRASIEKGFKHQIGDNIYHFSYSVTKQQNFSDTMRLFENSMIEEVGWSAYLDGEKVRLKLNNEEFERLYLAGVKHKNDNLDTLNDVLVPLIDKAETIDEVSLIHWSDDVTSQDFYTDNS